MENVKLFNVDPTPYIKEAKLKEEERIKAEKDAERVRQRALENGEEIEETKQEPAAAASGAQEAAAASEPAEPDYVSYDDPSMTLYEMFG